MIKLAQPEMGEEEIAEVTKVLKSGFLVQGKYVEKFERRMAQYLEIKYAVAVSSGTAALHLSLIALGISAGDEVILPDFTFPATGNVVALVGAKPILVDIELRTYNIDTAEIEKQITARTKAIIPVHLFGQSADLDPILKIAKKYRLNVIEDAACALGSTYKGRKCGTIGDVGCFSFHPRKVITTGEGGLIVTDDIEMANAVKALRNHGIVHERGRSRFQCAGYNYRMTDLQGALGWSQMKKLAGIIRRRRSSAELYDSLLRDDPQVRIPFVADYSHHIYQSYVVLLDERLDRDEVIAKLRERGVESNIGTYALHCQPFFQKNYSHQEGDLASSFQMFRHSLCLPLHHRMSEENIQRVVKILKESIER